MLKEIDNSLLILGYEKKDNYYFKKYNGYLIKVDSKNYVVDYGKEIKMDRRTTLDLSRQAESMVVLESIDKLLTLGYAPNKIILEKAYPSGRRDQGVFLDILVLDKNNKPFMMIECKTQSEYYIEVDKTIKNGGQIFSYFNSDRSPSFLILYSSKISSNKVHRNYSVINTKEISGSNKSELYKSWNKVFEKTGIFEDDCIPYSIEFKGLKKGHLKPLSEYEVNTRTQEGTIFNRFSEILRRNSISDKNNAYNKIFNLFLCKIVDEEERTDDEYMWFQWRESESAEDVLSRLNDLYKQGMDKFLKLEITDFSEKELNSLLNVNDSLANKDEVVDMFRKLRLYKNNEFAFNEVINERTFDENAKVVKEVVKMLEEYQLKYSAKQQFLGDFFEKLLNIGVKQEAGQFFTPIPITTYIVNSLPIENIVQNKINNREEHFLPYFIDYACGSGHFLTEGMHRIDTVLKKISEDKLITRPQKRNYDNWFNDYMWASEFAYGIDLDYRLTKTTKVACFLNGDGEANIYYADGLDNFNSLNYSKRLKSSDRNNEQFDIVIANPPYSVNQFDMNLPTIKEDFDLANLLSEKSDAIETIFVERTYQLLKEGGIAGIILPDTILIKSTPGLFVETRKHILKNFRIVGITYLGQQTFIKTTTTTVVLFLEKRNKTVISNADNLSKRIINNLVNQKTFDTNDFDDYLNNRDLSKQDYIDNIITSKDYRKEEEFNLSMFLLNRGHNVIITKTGNKEDELEFLGYKHTNMRNYEGIIPYPDNPQNIIKSKLYNDSNIFDEEKASYYVLNNFLNNNIEKSDIDVSLKDNVSVIPLNDIVILPNRVDEKAEYLIIPSEPKIIEAKDTTGRITLKELVKDGLIDSGENAPKKSSFIGDFDKESIFIRAKHLNNLDGNYIKLQKDNYFNLDNVNRKLYKKGSIVFPKSGQSTNTNNIALLPQDAYVVNHLAIIYIKDETLRDYVFYLLKHFETSNLKLSDTGYPTIRLSSINKLEIPLIDNMKDFVKELNSITRMNINKNEVRKKEKAVFEKYNLLYIN